MQRERSKELLGKTMRNRLLLTESSNSDDKLQKVMLKRETDKR